ncbi:MAG TPA: hypothetical protein VJT31_09445, partial [Rugosimonospora sp.]|nr:hypothetical protein [Rugosimonospora sp.]
TAAKVSIDFITSAPLGSPTWTVSAGRCLRSPAETACLFGTLKPGASAWAAIGGVLAKTLARGARVRNTVTLTSDTALADPGHAVAHADFTTPGGTPSPAAPSGPSASAPAAAGAAKPAAHPLNPLWMIPPAVVLAGGVLALVLTLRSRRTPATR